MFRKEDRALALRWSGEIEFSQISGFDDRANAKRRRRIIGGPPCVGRLGRCCPSTVRREMRCGTCRGSTAQKKRLIAQHHLEEPVCAVRAMFAMTL